MDKIYFSKVSDPEDWSCKSYWFPFAEKIATMKYGWRVLKIYLAIRLWFES